MTIAMIINSSDSEDDRSCNDDIVTSITLVSKCWLVC